ncbi:MAG: hypothetical protein ACK4UK_06695 [Flavobacterium sp.]
MRPVVITILLSLILISCNFSVSDSYNELPSGYIYSFEGGDLNRVSRYDKLIFDKGVHSYSFNDKFIFFAVDTSNPKEFKNKSLENLVFYIHDIEQDTLSLPLNHDFVEKFNEFNKINKSDNIFLQDFIYK